MLINIKVCKNRYIEPSRRYLGTTGEHNATVLRFVFFKELNGKLVSELKKELVAVNSKGSFPYEFTDEFSIPSELTTDTEISFQIKLYEGNTLVWKSVPHTFTLDQSIDDSGNNTIQSVVDEAKEAYRASLASSISVATGDDHSGKTWDEMVEAVRDMSLEPFIEPMLGFFEEYYVDFNETPVDPDIPDIPIDPDIPAEQNEGGDENVTE